MYLKNLSINQTKQEHFAKGYNHFGQTILCDYVSVVEYYVISCTCTQVKLQLISIWVM